MFLLTVMLVRLTMVTPATTYFSRSASFKLFRWSKFSGNLKIKETSVMVY